MTLPGVAAVIEPYYSTYTRPSDGAVVTNRGQVIAPPFWVSVVLAEQRRLLAPFGGVEEWDWPKVPEAAR